MSIQSSRFLSTNHGVISADPSGGPRLRQVHRAQGKRPVLSYGRSDFMANSDNSLRIRRSSRIHVRIPATISGTLADGREYRQGTFIVSVSKYGASLETDLPLEVGMVVNVQPAFRPQPALFRVVWTSRGESARTREVGIEYLEVSDLLGVSFPE